MLGSLLIIVVAVVVSALEVPNLKKKNDTKGMYIFFSLLVIGVTFWMLRSFHVNLPNPSEGLLFILKPLIDLLALK